MSTNNRNVHECGETAILLELLEVAGDLHSLKTEISICLKSGFFNITKARLAAGSLRSAGFSALDAREELEAVVTAELTDNDNENFMSSAMRKLNVPGGRYMQKFRDCNTAENAQKLQNLRQRGHANFEYCMITEEPDSSPSKDTIQIFGGMVPPALRKAKKNFTSALDYAFLAANLTQKIILLHQKLSHHRDM